MWTAFEASLMLDVQALLEVQHRSKTQNGPELRRLRSSRDAPPHKRLELIGDTAAHWTRQELTRDDQWCCPCAQSTMAAGRREKKREHSRFLLFDDDGEEPLPMNLKARARAAAAAAARKEAATATATSEGPRMEDEASVCPPEEWPLEAPLEGILGGEEKAGVAAGATAVGATAASSSSDPASSSGSSEARELQENSMKNKRQVEYQAAVRMSALCLSSGKQALSCWSPQGKQSEISRTIDFWFVYLCRQPQALTLLERVNLAAGTLGSLLLAPLWLQRPLAFGNDVASSCRATANCSSSSSTKQRAADCAAARAPTAMAAAPAAAAADAPAAKEKSRHRERGKYWWDGSSLISQGFICPAEAFFL